MIALLDHRADPSTAEVGSRRSGDRRSGGTGDVGPIRCRSTAAGHRRCGISGCRSAGHPPPDAPAGVHSVAESTAKGRSLAQLIRSGCALFTMHTNADQATNGVNDALADVVGPDVAPTHPAFGPGRSRPPRRLHAPRPRRSTDRRSGAGRCRTHGDYDSCAYQVSGTGQFRPPVGGPSRIGTTDRSNMWTRRASRWSSLSRQGRTSSPPCRPPCPGPAFSLVASRAIPGQTGHRSLGVRWTDHRRAGGGSPRRSAAGGCCSGEVFRFARSAGGLGSAVWRGW